MLFVPDVVTAHLFRSQPFRWFVAALFVTGGVSLSRAETVREAAEPAVSGNVAELIGEPIPDPPAGFADHEGFVQALRDKQITPSRHNVAAPDAQVETDIVYATYSDVQLTLDLYRPQQRKSRHPGLILIHGGGWKLGSKKDYCRYGSDFAARGYVTVSIDYRLAPDHPFPAAIQDCKAAVRWMRANADRYQIDPDRIAVMGGSAGGHLALLAAYSDDPSLEGDGGNSEYSSRVQAVVDIYGPSKLHEPRLLEFPPVNEMVTQFLGGNPEEQPANYALASPLTSLDAHDPPTLILHGTIDTLVPIVQADLLAAKLAELQVPYVYDRAVGWPHGMDFTSPMYERMVWLSERFLHHALRLQELADSP